MSTFLRSQPEIYREHLKDFELEFDRLGSSNPLRSSRQLRNDKELIKPDTKDRFQRVNNKESSHGKTGIETVDKYKGINHIYGLNLWVGGNAIYKCRQFNKKTKLCFKNIQEEIFGWKFYLAISNNLESLQCRDQAFLNIKECWHFVNMCVYFFSQKSAYIFL